LHCICHRISLAIGAHWQSLQHMSSVIPQQAEIVFLGG
jgi:hypothetical protein